MSVAQFAVLETDPDRTLAERLVDQLANRIGGLGVELADVAGNVQEVATRVASRAPRPRILAIATLSSRSSASSPRASTCLHATSDMPTSRWQSCSIPPKA